MNDAQACLHTLLQAHRDALLGCDYDVSREDVEEATRALCYSVEVRSSWTGPGEQMLPGEFRLLLAGNGSTVHITGELDGMFEPDAVALLLNGEPLLGLTKEQQAAMTWFAELFTYHVA